MSKTNEIMQLLLQMSGDGQTGNDPSQNGVLEPVFNNKVMNKVDYTA